MMMFMGRGKGKGKAWARARAWAGLAVPSVATVWPEKARAAVVGRGVAWRSRRRR